MQFETPLAFQWPDISVTKRLPKHPIFYATGSMLDMGMFLAVLICALWEWRSGRLTLAPSARQIAEFLTATIGLDIIHNSFTFAMIATVPELKNWAVKATRGRPHILWMKGFLIFISTFITICWAYNIFHAPLWYSVLALSCLAFLAGHHTFSQQLGLGLATVMAVTRDQAPDWKITTSLRIESWLKWALFSNYFLFALISMVRLRLHSNPSLDFFHRCATVGMWVTICLLIANTLWLPAHVRWHKLRFTSRLFLALFPTSLAWVLGSRCMHGYEYLAVTETVVTNSHKRSVGQNAFRKTLLIFGSLTFFLILFRGREGLVPLALGLPSLEELPVAVRLLGVASISLGFVHYYFDAVLFRMRDPATRQIVGPLLTRDHSEV